MRRSLLLPCIAVSLTAGRAANAQPRAVPRPPPTDSACTYSECALAIVPTWNGLAVVRGNNGPRVANLHFFWPRQIAPALRGPDGAVPGADSAAAHARRAVSLRRVGAALTDVGVLAAGVAVARSVQRGRARRTEQVLGGAGIGALLISVPFQFAADGALSRAVWWHNVRYVR